MKTSLRFKVILFGLLLSVIAISIYGLQFGYGVHRILNLEQISPGKGHQFTAKIKSDCLWPLYMKVDSLEDPKQSKTILLEQGAPIGKPHALHSDISLLGKGLFSHWDESLLFSSSDNSDPRYNGRVYEIVLPLFLNQIVAWLIILSSILIFISFLFFSMAPKSRRGFSIILFILAVDTAILYLLSFSFGILFWIGTFLIALTLIYIIRLISGTFGYKMPVIFMNSVIVFGSITFCLLSFEIFLSVDRLIADKALHSKMQITVAQDNLTIPLSSEGAANIRRRSKVKILPQEWKKEIIQAPGTKYILRWHGVQHVHDENNFRRSVPFSPKKLDVMRILVLGDSLTYGFGIEEKFTYTNLLQESFGKNFKIEFLNLGTCGAQSEDVLNTLKHFLSILNPDLVLYGMCQNDFLPSGVGVYNKITSKILPETLPAFLTDHSLVAQFINDHYKGTLRKLGILQDFYDDILANFSNYQKRFAKDVAEMNQIVVSNGRPPIIAMVLDHVPVYEGTGYNVTKIAEQAMELAGMQVIKTEEYYKKFDGRSMLVSRWEEHPNEEAHAIFASMFYDKLINMPALEVYRKKENKLNN